MACSAGKRAARLIVSSGTMSSNVAFEKNVSNILPITPQLHAIAARFPLPETPMIFETREGKCLFANHVCKNALIEHGSSFNPDAHIRDLEVMMNLFVELYSFEQHFLAGTTISQHGKVVRSSRTRRARIKK